MIRPRHRPGPPLPWRQPAAPAPGAASGSGGPGAIPNALVEGFQAAFLGAAVIAAIGLVLTFVMIRSSDSREHVALSKKESAQPVAT